MLMYVPAPEVLHSKTSINCNLSFAPVERVAEKTAGRSPRTLERREGLLPPNLLSLLLNSNKEIVKLYDGIRGFLERRLITSKQRRADSSELTGVFNERF